MYNQGMKRLRIFLIATIMLYTVFHTNTQAGAAETYVFQVSEKRFVSYEKMLDDLRGGPRLIFVGEAHGHEIHHRQQFNIIKALNDSKTPLAVGLEMLTSRNQGKLDMWAKGAIPVDDFVKAYYKEWNVPWSYYNDIFLYLRDNKIPIIALSLPKEISQKVGKTGFSSLNSKELGELPSGIVCKVDKKYMDFIKKAYGSHQYTNKDFVFFCEAQLLKDKTMALLLSKFLEKNPDRTVVVLAGTTHAWKKGVPEQIRNLSKGLSYSVILPQIPGSIEPSNITVEDADYILLNNLK